MCYTVHPGWSRQRREVTTGESLAYRRAGLNFGATHPRRRASSSSRSAMGLDSPRLGCGGSGMGSGDGQSGGGRKWRWEEEGAGQPAKHIARFLRSLFFVEKKRALSIVRQATKSETRYSKESEAQRKRARQRAERRFQACMQATTRPRLAHLSASTRSCRSLWSCESSRSLKKRVTCGWRQRRK